MESATLTGVVTPDESVSRTVKPDEPWAESGAVNEPSTWDEIVSVADGPLNVEVPDSETTIVLLVPSVVDDTTG